MTNPKILFFDSGIGGLSVYAEVKNLVPYAHYYYLFDHECFPYGNKSELFLQNRVKDLLAKAHEQENFDLIVIACNTASTTVLPRIREFFTIPIVGVVPAIKPAAKISKKKIIALLATPGTVHRSYTDFLINEFAYDCKVLRVGSEPLVRLAEDALTTKAKLNQTKESNYEQAWQSQLTALEQNFDYDKLRQILEPIWSLDTKDRPDVVVLGCTHFPLLKCQIHEVLGDDFTLIDSGKAIARRVVQLLGGVASEHHSSCSLSYSEEDLSFNQEQTQKSNAILALYTGKLSEQEYQSFVNTFSLFGFKHLQSLKLH